MEVRRGGGAGMYDRMLPGTIDIASRSRRNRKRSKVEFSQPQPIQQYDLALGGTQETKNPLAVQI